jgi:hypothetical protein
MIRQHYGRYLQLYKHMMLYKSLSNIAAGYVHIAVAYSSLSDCLVYGFFP